MTPASLSVVIPAKDESATIAELVGEVRRVLPQAEVVVVDDGSSDGTGELAREAGARVVRHPVSRGNGAAVKSGARAANGELMVLMDGDGQHDPADIPRLLAELDAGYDLAVGARTRGSQASVARLFGNTLYNWLASRMVGHPVKDLTSGFRAVRTERFREFLHLYPNGFSYPTTSTMAFFRAGYGVSYVPIRAYQRVKNAASHISIVRDGGRFLLIIFRIGTLYSPLKIFVPVSVLFFMLGTIQYVYTFVTQSRFTNMGALLYSVSVLVLLIGLVSEQITGLSYQARRDD